MRPLRFSKPLKVFELLAPLFSRLSELVVCGFCRGQGFLRFLARFAVLAVGVRATSNVFDEYLWIRAPPQQCVRSLGGYPRYVLAASLYPPYRKDTGIHTKRKVICETYMEGENGKLRNVIR